MGNLVDRIFDSGRLIGIPTGFPSFDRVVGGIRTKTLTVIAGATGMGKSLLGLAILVRLAKAGKDVLYFDLENGEEQSMERVLRIWFELPQEFFVDAKNKPRAEKMLEEVSEYFSYWGHEDVYKQAEIAEEDLLTVIERLMLRNPASVILIDPLQALETGYSKRETFEQQGLVVRRLKEFAQTNGKAILLCHHIRKSVGGAGQWVKDVDDIEETRYRVPTIEDLRGSGKISDFATDVWGIVRTANHPQPEGRGKTFIRVLKSRGGYRGDVKELFLDETTLAFKDSAELDGVVAIYGTGL